MEKKRNSNFELLRILAIVLITLNHITTKGLTLDPSTGSLGNNALALLYSCGGKFGCILFLLITVWFLSDEKINWKRILMVWYQTFIYYFMFNVVFMLINHNFTLAGIVRFFLPIMNSNYWYSRCYIILLLFFPLTMKVFRINPFKKTFLVLGAILLLLPVLFISRKNNDIFGMICKILRLPIVSFFYFAILLYYIKNYVPYQRISSGVYIASSIVLYAVMWFVVTIIFYRSGPYSCWRDIYSPFNYLSAFCLFLGFATPRSRYNKWINVIAAFSFDIYLFQCHEKIKPVLWNSVFPFDKWYGMNFWYFLFFTVMATAAICAIGSVFALLYQHIFSKPMKYLLKKIDSYINTRAMS